MPKTHKPRSGSLQFWPRKRAKKLLPSVNWKALQKQGKKEVKNRILGFIAYKAGMASASVLDKTPNSLTKGKKIVLPVTVLECPPMKILSIRAYKNNVVSREFLNENLDKELKRKIKLPKQKRKINFDGLKEFEDIRITVYPLIKRAGIKKTPDIAEISLAGSAEEKINFLVEYLNKEITISEIFEKQLVDIRGLTKGHGIQGPVKRFGIGLKQHKSEKGRRRPGSLGPWHPARVTFRAPMAGQLGMFTRLIYNSKIIKTGNANEINKEFKHYGKIKTDFIAVVGSVQGPQKRQLLITSPLRKTKKQDKKDYEFLSLM